MYLGVCRHLFFFFFFRRTFMRFHHFDAWPPMSWVDNLFDAPSLQMTAFGSGAFQNGRTFQFSAVPLPTFTFHNLSGCMILMGIGCSNVAVIKICWTIPASSHPLGNSPQDWPTGHPNSRFNPMPNHGFLSCSFGYWMFVFFGGGLDSKL